MFEVLTENVRSILSDISITIVIVLFIALFLWGLQRGRRALIFLIFAIFVSGVLSLLFPLQLFGVGQLEPISRAAVRLGTFGVVLVLVYWGIAGRFLLEAKKKKFHLTGKGFFYLLWFSLVSTGLLVSLALMLLSPGAFTNLNEFVRVVFGQPLAAFLWALLAAVSLFL